MGVQEKSFCSRTWSTVFSYVFSSSTVSVVGLLVVGCLCCLSVVSVGSSFCCWLSGVGCRVLTAVHMLIVGCLRRCYSCLLLVVGESVVGC